VDFINWPTAAVIVAILATLAKLLGEYIASQQKPSKAGTETERFNPVSKGDIVNKCAQHEREIAVMKAEAFKNEQRGVMERENLNKRLDLMDERFNRVESSLTEIQKNMNTLIGLLKGK
jgi:primosomal protein N''